MVLESNTLDYIFLQDGENGVGTPGKDGKTLYTWVKYSQNANGSNMSDSPENALYIGIAYNKDSATESTNANDYNWTKIKGEQGLPGTDAYTIILSNESHTFSGTVTSAIASSTKCYIIAYKGTKQLSVTIGTISNLPEGMTAPISNNGTTNAYFSPTVTSLMTTKNGTLTIPITVDGKTFTKYFSYSLALQGNNGISATNIILSNESHTFSANASGQADATSINIDILGFTGTTQVRTQIGELSGLPTGMTMKINNNGTINTSITVSVTSSLTTSQGTVKIPITADGVTVEKSFSYALSRTGETGAQGIQGLQGEQGIPGTDGKTSYFHIKYSSVSNPTSSSQMTETPSTYIGTYVDFSSTDSTDPSKYTWSRFQGIQGETGEQGIPGINGSNGKTSYLHIKYSNDGGKTFTANNGETAGDYIGQYVDFVQADSASVGNYTWSKVKGDKGDTGATGAAGKGIKSITNYYLATTASSGVTTSTSGWTTSIQSITSSKRYLWNYEVVTYTDNTTSTTTPVIIGVWGNTGSTGKTGKGIKSITEYYLASSASSGVTTSTSGWSTSMQTTTTTNKYLWNYEKITYTDDTTSNSTVRIIGTHGATGATGTAAKSVDITASSQVFKSTDGGSTFSPDTIKLTPVFQGGISYSKWQYSTNGGSSWTDVSSGSHGLTISSGVLTIAKTSDLYTSSVTSISFKCISNNTSYYDTITVLKLYDVTGLQDDLEDLQNQITTITDTISGVESKVNANTKSITDKIWQTDISTSINEYDGSTVKKIRDRVASTETDISGIKTTLSDVQTTVSKKADGSTVQTLSTKFATMESNFNGFKTTVSNTYTTKEDFNNLEIGGRNLLRGTKFNTISNISSDVGSGVTCDVVNQKDSSSPSGYSLTITRTDSTTTIGGRYISMPYKLTNGKVYTWNFYAKGSGSWKIGNEQNGQKTITLTSDYVRYSYTFTANNNSHYHYQFVFYTQTKNANITICGVKLELGNKATDWTPAPEDVEQSITSVSSQYTQLSNKFNWVVKSGTSSSDFTITDRVISLTSSALNIDALTTFKNSAENGTSTVINGGAIKSNTITTSKLATDAIKSTNYSYSSGNFSSAGTFLDLSTGLVRSKNFGIDSSGNVYLKGNIQANAGYIGGTSGWAITTNTITGNANSKIISGILQSSNYVENSTGVQVNLNTGIIKGNIEASTLAAKEAIKIYVGSTKRNVITGHLASDFFYVRIGCDLSTSNIARVKPSIILNKSTASTNVSDMITINTSALDIEANTSIIGSLSASDISTCTNGGTWISGKTSAAINILTSQSESSFHPVLRISSYSGNVWCLGGLGDTVGIYGYYSGRTANGYDWCTTWDTSNGNLTTTNNINCNDIKTRTGWAADRLSHGETAYSNLMSGRISFKWVQNSSGVWRIYVYVDGALVRDW